MQWAYDIVAKAVMEDATLEDRLAIEQEEFIGAIIHGHECGNLMLVGSKSTQTVIMVNPISDTVAELHLYTLSTSSWDIVKAVRKIIEWLWNNTEFHRFETIAYKPAIWALAKRVGWEYEGTRREVFVLDGEWVDEKAYAAIRRN